MTVIAPLNAPQANTYPNNYYQSTTFNFGLPPSVALPSGQNGLLAGQSQIAYLPFNVSSRAPTLLLSNPATTLVQITVNPPADIIAGVVPPLLWITLNSQAVLPIASFITAIQITNTGGSTIYAVLGM